MNPMQSEIMDWTGCSWVDTNPARLHGAPCLVNTRMNVDGVIWNFEGGMSIDELVEEFGQSRAAVLGVLEFSGRLRTANAA